MKVSELFRRLSYGQLKNLAISADGSGSIVADSHPAIIQYTNEALLRLHSRFNLKFNDVVIQQVGHISTYYLRKKYSATYNASLPVDERVPYPYIRDQGGEVFMEDVIKILEVHDDVGCAQPLNDPELQDSLFTPQPDMLQIPFPVNGQPLGIMYQARHEVLKDEGEGLLDQEVEIPFFLEGALQNYVGHLVFSHMGSQEQMAKSQEYLALYEGICQEVESKDLVSQTVSTSHNKLERRGFR